MKRIAIAELDWVALDWAVAEVEGKKRLHTTRRKFGMDVPVKVIPAYSGDWSQCGPLIERYRVDVLHEEANGEWLSSVDAIHCAIGTTPLIAACRAIVAAHNPSGFVEVPDELVEEE